MLSPHLVFDGRCEEAFGFYEKNLGGKIQFMMNHEGAPVKSDVPAGWGKKIMHATIAIDGQIVMGMDAPPQRYQKPQGIFISLDVKEPKDAERIFNALSDRGSVEMPLQKTFWAKAFGMVTDQFGIPWMVNCGEPNAQQ